METVRGPPFYRNAFLYKGKRVIDTLFFNGIMAAWNLKILIFPIKAYIKSH